jgi:hypothetical protein
MKVTAPDDEEVGLPRGVGQGFDRLPLVDLAQGLEGLRRGIDPTDDSLEHVRHERFFYHAFRSLFGASSPARPRLTAISEPRRRRNRLVPT